MRHSPPFPHHPRLFAVAMLWLVAGALLLLTTLVPAHTELLGWTPLFWLLGAPVVALLGLEPALLQLVVRRRRRVTHGVAWH
ncbi:MAG TPA: hypothetical protein VN624_01455 [Rhodanobacter sp.]|jgi:hypothetical protein|nr:hypothetical protein [Rhodanobacter sp.]